MTPRKTKVSAPRARSGKPFRADRDIARYLAVSLETGGPKLFVEALDNVVRAKGLARVAAKAGLPRQSLVDALSPDGRMEFAEVLEFVQYLGLKVAVEANT